MTDLRNTLAEIAGLEAGEAVSPDPVSSAPVATDSLATASLISEENASDNVSSDDVALEGGASSAVASEGTPSGGASGGASGDGASGGGRRSVLEEIANLGADEPALTNGEAAKKKAAKSGGADAFPEPVKELTQKGPDGITFDFNLGARVHVPAGKWTIRLHDLDTASPLFAASGDDLTLVGRKKHFQRLRLEVEKDGALFWSHDYDAAGKKVAVILPGGTLGDSLAWFPYAARFAEVHKCKLYVVLAPHIRDLISARYPDLVFLLREEFTEDIKAEMYATYYLGLFFQDEHNDYQPADFRMLGLHRTAGSILGVDQSEIKPLVSVQEPDASPLSEPYVAIAVQASSACKLWNNPNGWHDVVAHLKALGYRVVCIDKEPFTGSGLHWNHLPNGVEDETGERPLAERVRWLKHAEFFVGLSSGLSWLAWAAGARVVMISGFTHPLNEFHTPWRVFSTNSCNSCWHDVRVPFQHNNYLFCPRHEGTPKAFDCTRQITSAYVMQTIDRLMREEKLTPPNKRRKRRKKRST